MNKLNLVRSGLTEIKKRWRNAWQLLAFRKQAFTTLFVLLSISFFMRYFFDYIQARKGYTINDSLLNHIHPHDMSVYIFGVIYMVIIISLVKLIPHPFLLLKGFQAYTLLIILRVVSLWLTPLEPAQSVIPLVDPLVTYFFYDGAVITKDLFFSGHVSILFLIFLSVPGYRFKYLNITAVFFVAAMIMIQHVHYTIDVLAAPAFAWISYSFVNRFILMKKKEPNSSY